MYLIITPEGPFYVTDKVSSADLRASHVGTIRIIDISDPATPLWYRESEWAEVERTEQPEEEA